MEASSYDPSSSQPLLHKPNDQSRRFLSQRKPGPVIQAPTSENSRAISTLDKAVEYEMKYGRKLDPNMDVRRLRRIVSNRLSAHRARLRKDNYITELEKKTSQLQEKVSVLTAKVKSCKDNLKLLMLQNQSLQRLLHNRLDEAKLAETELQKKRMELSMLHEEVASSAYVGSGLDMAPVSGFEMDQYLNLQG